MLTFTAHDAHTNRIGYLGSTLHRSDTRVAPSQRQTELLYPITIREAGAERPKGAKMLFLAGNDKHRTQTKIDEDF